VLLVHLRHSPGQRPAVTLDTNKLPWEDYEGIKRKILFSQDDFNDKTELLFIPPGKSFGPLVSDGKEIFIIKGDLHITRNNENIGVFYPMHYFRFPGGDEILLYSSGGCEIYVKHDFFSIL